MVYHYRKWAKSMHFRILNSPVPESQEQSLERLERTTTPLVAKASECPDGFVVAPHAHSRAQLIHALTGVITVTTAFGRWMVPPGHALWIPAHVVHSVVANGDVSLRSLYVMPGAVEGLPATSRVVGMTDLMRSLMIEAVKFPMGCEAEGRAGLIMALILEEIPHLPELPLGLPFPADPKLAGLCARFVQNPSAGASIDGWADRMGMSRRTFTRFFRRETGVSLSDWRQQASIFAALPRLARGDLVTNVALDLGYDSPAAFTVMFKRMTGVAPSSYLRNAEA
jgi:AraC-like DNA-binding protein/quercetin dioxygenase-like cupin family protein